MKYPVLTIAGFDGGGGAGLQADLKTFAAMGGYGLSVLTSLPIQNTYGVRRCYEIPLSAIQDQLESIFDDIRPYAIKIGMLFKREIISLVAAFLRQHAERIPLVLDPVMVSTSGHLLLQEGAVNTLKEELLPLSTLVTPNLPEAYALTNSQDSIPLLAEKILDLGGEAVLVKGGHLAQDIASDYYLHQNGDKQEFTASIIKTRNTHGTGCTLSAAIAAGLARGLTLKEACGKAKKYLTHALIAAEDLSVGEGFGPMDHFYHLKENVYA